MSAPLVSIDSVNTGPASSGAAGSSAAGKRLAPMAVSPYSINQLGGGLYTVTSVPVVECSFVYGAPDLPVTLFLEGGGAATPLRGRVTIDSGAVNPGGAGIRYNIPVTPSPGQAGYAKISGYCNNATNNFQVFGISNLDERVGVGAINGALGIFYETGGLREIRTLTILTPAGAAEDLTLEVDNQATLIPLGAAATVEEVANEIANYMLGSGLGNVSVARAIGATVVIVAASAGPTSGSWTLTSTGSVTGSFATDLVGVATSPVIVASSSFNIDKLDGTGPSGATVSPFVLQTYTFTWTQDECIVGVLVDGRNIPCHNLSIVNRSASSLFRDPAMYMFAQAQNLGLPDVNPVMTLKSFVGGLYDGGSLGSGTASFSASAAALAVAAPTVLLSLQGGASFGSPLSPNNVCARITGISLGVSTGVTGLRIYKQALVADGIWVTVDQYSTVYKDTVGTDLSGGVIIAEYACGANSGTSLTLPKDSLTLSPFERLTFAVDPVGAATPDVLITVNWTEDV